MTQVISCWYVGRALGENGEGIWKNELMLRDFLDTTYFSNDRLRVKIKHEYVHKIE